MNTNEDKESTFPYDLSKQQAIQNFFKKMAKKPSGKEFYGYDENGNLIITDKDDKVLSSIELFYYRPYSKAEFQDIETERLNKIIELENIIEVQKKKYRETVNFEDKFNIHSEIQELEKQKTYLISPYNTIKKVKGLEIRDVQLDEAKEKRKQKLVYQNVRRDFPLWKLYGIYTKSKEILEVSEQKGIRLETGEVFLTNGRVARFFNDNESGNEFLSIFAIHEFIYNDTNFSSAYQAFEVTRLMELNKEDLAKKVLNTRSIKTIRYLVREVRDKIDDTKDLWYEILSEYYKQHGNLIKALVNTKDCMLVFANTNPYLGGIGLTVEDENRLDPKNWKQNILGEVLMGLRSEFMQGTKEEAKVGGFTKSVVTEEQLEQRKKGAIINAMKKH